jgi:hypothetical protein
MRVTDATLTRADRNDNKKRQRLRIALAVGLVLVLCYVGLLKFSPEVGDLHIRGPVILNVSGAGYGRGDVVWLSGPQGECDPQAAVLYDWRRIDGRTAGFGPHFAIAVFGTLDARQRRQLVAVVRFRLGYDPFRARSFSNRVY